MTADADAEDLARALATAPIRHRLGAYRPLTQWPCLVLLSLYADRVGPGAWDGERISPSGHETALFRLLAICDVDHLARLSVVYPEQVAAWAVWAYEPDGSDRLARVAAGLRDDGPADAPYVHPPATMWEALDRQRVLAEITDDEWSIASCRTRDVIAAHRAFPRLVRAVAAGEYRRRTRALAAALVADIGLDPRIEPAAIAVVLARDFVRARESGARP